MKKLLSLFIFIAISGTIFSQFTQFQYLGNPKTLITSKGGFKADSALIYPYFFDTTTANIGTAVKKYPGNVIRTAGDFVWIRNSDTTAWILIFAPLPSGWLVGGNTLSAEEKLGSLNDYGVSLVANNNQLIGLGTNTGYGGRRTVSFGNNGDNDPNPNNSTLVMYDNFTYDGTALNHDLVGFGMYQGVTKTVGGTGSVFGFTPEVRFNSGTTNGVSGYYGAQVTRTSLYTAPGSTGSINKGYSLLATAHLEGMDIDSMSKIYIENSYRPAGGTVANNFGLFIQPQVGGSTNNFNIYSAGTSTTGGNVFGGGVVGNSGFFSSRTVNNGLMLNSTGSYYGTVQNDAADKWSLGFASGLHTLGTPVLSWTPTEVRLVPLAGSGTGVVGVDNDGDLFWSAGGTQTLQQVFNTEVGGSVLTKEDTIAMNTFGLTFLNGRVGIGAVSNSLFRVGSGANSFLVIDPDNDNYFIGDANGIGNSTYMDIVDASSNIDFNAAGAMRWGVDTLATRAYARSVGGAGGGTPSLMKNVTLEFPSATENFGFGWKTPVDITITSVDAVLLGSASPSVTFQIAFGTDRTSGTNVYTSGRTTTSTTTGDAFSTSFNDATIPAGSWIWITTSAQSGTVTQMELQINYTED